MLIKNSNGWNVVVNPLRYLGPPGCPSCTAVGLGICHKHVVGGQGANQVLGKKPTSANASRHHPLPRPTQAATARKIHPLELAIVDSFRRNLKSQWRAMFDIGVAFDFVLDKIVFCYFLEKTNPSFSLLIIWTGGKGKKRTVAIIKEKFPSTPDWFANKLAIMRYLTTTL